MKRVAFSPQLTTVSEYNSPYLDPSFMASKEDDDQWRRVRKNYSTKLNYAEKVSLKYIVYNLIDMLFDLSGNYRNVSKIFYGLF